MKKTPIFKTIAIALFLGVASVSAIQASSLSKLLSPKIARGDVDITCDCALLHGNKLCAANNYGATCAPTGTTDCSQYNSNCEG